MNIKIIINNESFVSDVQPLVKAFYPDKEVKVRVLKDGCEENKDETASEILVRVDIPLDYAGNVNISIGDNYYSELPRYGETNAVGKDATDKVAVRNCMKRLLYRALREASHRELPWGSLTGIRPTRIALARLMSGSASEEIRDVMLNDYYVTGEKTDLALDIAKREHDLLQKVNYKGGYSLYVGIPFCPTTCLYCSFASNPIVSWKDRIDEYLTVLEKELYYVSESFAGRELNSIYIGGGTPTALSAMELDRLISFIKAKFDISKIKEFTVESGRPDSITEDKLRVMYDHGIDRISINPQTMKDETLKIIGRHHSVAQTLEAYELARKIGFDNINMDIILGLPGEDISDVSHTMEVIKKLSPASLTVHSLAVKRAAALPEWMKINGADSICNTPDMMRVCQETAQEMGLLPYYLYRQKNMSGNFENVGYAREGCFGVYNILMMEEVQTIVACGAGTVTKRVSSDGNISRCDNVKDVGLYIEKIDEMIERKRRLFEDEK